MRRLFASLLIVALVALTSAPRRMAVEWAPAPRPSIASAPARDRTETSTLERAGQARVAPIPIRWQLHGSSSFALIFAGDKPAVSASWSANPAKTWLRDVRDSIRRVCPRFIPAPSSDPVSSV